MANSKLEQDLQYIAQNLWWCWTREAWRLFRRIDPERWTSVNFNPVQLIDETPPERFQALLKDDVFLSHLDDVKKSLDHYLSGETWFSARHDHTSPFNIAYFSAEFGIHESLSIYCGGLGILSGDHMKSSSDLGIPLIGVGLMYRQGYFIQSIDANGWQQETYQDKMFDHLAFILQRDPAGNPMLLQITLPDGEVYAQIWRVLIGRSSLILLDTDVPQNTEVHRRITHHLYGGNVDMRIQQEMLLGIGGYRALKVLGVEASVFHMNEGHSAFLAVERIRDLMKTARLSYEEASVAVRQSSVFTTHTPVPAGNDWFPPEKVAEYLRPYFSEIGLSEDAFFSLGRLHPEDKKQYFCMTVLALRFASFANGVSELHGEVAREMWRDLWKETPLDQVPITSITNGVHLKSWVAPEMKTLFDRYIGILWKERPIAEFAWERVHEIPDDELWEEHEKLKSRLVSFCRFRFSRQLQRNQASQEDKGRGKEILDPKALTIGFARRFATYKRAAMIFQDPERLAKILTNPHRPVQVVFAGKSHPRDDAGKALIQKIVNLSKEEPFRSRIIFIEDYTIEVARYLVQGVDVWLNNPKRPLEASGTSGMKVVSNGGLNLSILDGWWAEAWERGNGWAIASHAEIEDDVAREREEGLSLYDVLEREVIPVFYERDARGIPVEWIKMMKKSISTLAPRFSTYRMVQEYYLKAYLPALKRSLELSRQQK